MAPSCEFSGEELCAGWRDAGQTSPTSPSEVDGGTLGSPAALVHRDVVLLPLPWREVDASLQSILVKRLQDHPLRVHVCRLDTQQQTR